MLAATTHIGSDNSEKTMEQYIFKKKNDGINIINLKKTWEKILLAARAIAAVENPQVTILQSHNLMSFNLTILLAGRVRLCQQALHPESCPEVRQVRAKL